jgi:hypothetical protein
MTIDELTDEERSVLCNYHRSKGRYWANCESNQRKIAKTADPNATDVFGGDPLSTDVHSDLTRTPENWLKRAEVFKAWKMERWRRARLFAK